VTEDENGKHALRQWCLAAADGEQACWTDSRPYPGYLDLATSITPRLTWHRGDHHSIDGSGTLDPDSLDQDSTCFCSSCQTKR